MLSNKTNDRLRVLTAFILAPLLIVLLYVRSWYLGVVLVVAVLLCIYEQYRALRMGGHDPASIATWIACILYLPLELIFPHKNFITPIFCLMSLAHIVIVITRPKPNFIDIATSMMPLITVGLPGMCLISFLNIKNSAVQVLFIVGTFSISMMCDIFAYEFGVNFGKTPFFNTISPHKTVEGAVGGLLGGIAGMALTGFIINTLFKVSVFPMWQLCIIGFFGAIVSQIGDLFASLLKRHCGIKDFGNLFPGHGGMLDRMDSVLFVATYLFMIKVLIF